MNIFNLIKNSFLKGFVESFVREFEKANRDTYPYKLFLNGVELGYFQKLNFKNQYVELERGLININWMEGVEKPISMVFDIRGPINVLSFRMDSLTMGQIVGRKVVAMTIGGMGDVVHNLDFFENGKD